MALLGELCLCSAAFHQRQARCIRSDKINDQGQEQDPPGRVGRLNYSQGSISFRPAGEDDWVTAVPNRPMVTGDDLWADENSRAEVHVGSAAIRLGAKTGITFLALDDRTTQIRLAQGSLILRVRHVDDDDTYEVDTPNLAFTLLQPGEYRIDVSEDGSQTVTTVWHGRGRVTGGGLHLYRGREPVGDLHGQRGPSRLRSGPDSPIETILITGHLIATSAKTAPTRRTMFPAK